MKKLIAELILDILGILTFVSIAPPIANKIGIEFFGMLGLCAVFFGWMWLYNKLISQLKGDEEKDYKCLKCKYHGAIGNNAPCVNCKNGSNFKKAEEKGGIEE
jgi:hypothetical protein